MIDHDLEVGDRVEWLDYSNVWQPGAVKRVRDSARWNYDLQLDNDKSVGAASPDRLRVMTALKFEDLKVGMEIETLACTNRGHAHRARERPQHTQRQGAVGRLSAALDDHPAGSDAPRPKTVADSVRNLLAQHLGPIAERSNIGELAKALVFSVVDALNAELQPLLNPVVQMNAADLTPEEEKFISTQIPGAGLSNSLSYWKCRALGCPDRPAKSAPEAPRCYTCDRKMERAEPEFLRPQAVDKLSETLDQLTRSIAGTGMIPKEYLLLGTKTEHKDLRQHAKKFDFGWPPVFGAPERAKVEMKLRLADAVCVSKDHVMRVDDGAPGAIPPPDGNSVSALQFGLLAIPEVREADLQSRGPGDIVIHVRYKPGLPEGRRAMLNTAIHQWLQYYTPAGVTLALNFFID